MDAAVYQLGDLSIHFGERGLDHYAKLSCPIRFGTYTEIRSDDFVFQFDLNHDITHIRGRGADAMPPSEWLKRTLGGDWVYYTSGGYNGAFDALGEYYVPCFTYASNPLLGGDPFRDGILDRALSALDRTLARLADTADGPAGRWARTARHRNTPSALRNHADTLHRLIRGPVTVLPPDARHTDYDVIPLTVAEGCLYNCRFCTVKTGRAFSPLSRPDIDRQIRDLQAFFGANLTNYNSIFLGQHDALQAGRDLILHAAESAFRAFGLDRSAVRGPRLFMFGSVDSLLGAPPALFRELSALPCEVLINIGLESAHGPTLRRLGKPLTPEKVTAAFDCMTDLNRGYPGLEITANVLYGESFSPDHTASLIELIQSKYPRFFPRGAVYVSPYGPIRDRRTLISHFKVFKSACRLPVFLYLIQRL
ncbi:hypothetical protein JCM14469_23010 [Desulfatiferula olefinivorans]